LVSPDVTVNSEERSILRNASPGTASLQGGEDPLTHTFALLALPTRFVEGDTFPITDVDSRFGSREEAIAALPDLLNRDERDPAIGLHDTARIDDLQLR
jgi:hypothetical protein